MKEHKEVKLMIEEKVEYCAEVCDNVEFLLGVPVSLPSEVKAILRGRVRKALQEATKEAVEDTIGDIGAKLLAKHSPQAVLDAYFDAANEIFEQHETNN